LAAQTEPGQVESTASLFRLSKEEGAEEGSRSLFEMRKGAFVSCRIGDVVPLELEGPQALAEFKARLLGQGWKCQENRRGSSEQSAHEQSRQRMIGKSLTLFGNETYGTYGTYK